MNFDKKKAERSRNSADVAFFMAIKNVFHKKAMLFMIIGIIGLGFLSTVFSSAIILGLKETIENKVINGIAGHVMIQPNADEDYIDGVSEIEKKILQIPHVISVSPRVGSYITLIDNQGTKITKQILIIDPDKERYTTNLNEIILDGKYLSAASSNEILVGAELTKGFRMMPSSDAIDVKAGEIINAVIQYEGQTISLPVKIRGIYGQEFMFTDDYAYMTEKGIMDIFGLTEKLDVATTISVKASDTIYANQIAQSIKELGIDAQVWVWSEKMGLLDQFVDSLMIISNLTGIIGVIIAFATIYIMIFINVLQKRSQIGIMKAIGINENTILFSYIIQSFIYGLFGTIFGILLTRFVLGYIDLNPVHMPMGYVHPVTSVSTYIMSSLFLLLSALVAGYFASRNVIREKILEAIFKG